MEFEFLSSTLEVIGTVFIAYAALRVHHRVLNERKVDQRVLKTMKKEQFIGWTGVIFIILGYIFSLPSF